MVFPDGQEEEAGCLDALYFFFLLPLSRRLSANTDPRRTKLKQSSHLTTLRNRHIEVRHVLAPPSGLGGLHLPDNVHPVHHTPEDDVLAVQEGRRHGGDEELGPIGIGPGVLLMIWGTN